MMLRQKITRIIKPLFYLTASLFGIPGAICHRETLSCPCKSRPEIQKLWRTLCCLVNGVLARIHAYSTFYVQPYSV